MRWLDSIAISVDMNLSKTPGDSEGQGSLACCNPRRPKELDATYQLNSNKVTNTLKALIIWGVVESCHFKYDCFLVLFL